MNVLFVNPPRANMIKVPAADVTFMSNRYPPLGLLYVATVTRDAGHKVEFFDYELGSHRIEEIDGLSAVFEPDVIGITCLTVNLYDTYETAKYLHAKHPAAKIVFGGPQIDIYPEETVRQPFIDYVVRGEGEVTFLELLRALETDGPVDNIKGLYFERGKEVVHTGTREKIVDLDAMPFPDRTLLKEEDYFSPLNPKLREATMISSRGCPHKCTFCSVGHMRYHYRGAADIVDEMELVLSQGYNFVQFVDDTFNLFNRKVFDICDEILARNLTIRWSFRGRVDHITDAMMARLKQAGCVRIYFGVESGNAEMLAATQKGTTLPQAERAFALANKYGIETLAYVMIGYVDETADQIRESIDFVIRIRASYANILIIIPFPGTQLYEECLANGMLDSDYLRAYSVHPVAEMAFRPCNRHLSEAELYDMISLFYRKFFFRPRYILKRLIEDLSVTAIVRKARMALPLLAYVLSKRIKKDRSTSAYLRPLE